MSGSRILIIADESETEFALQSDLKQMGHEVTGVISADEAIDDSTAHEPDLVIMDIRPGKKKILMKRYTPWDLALEFLLFAC